MLILPHRSVLRLTGDDVAVFLNSLLTNSTLNMHKSEARYAALLTPQGKIISDMFVIKADDALYFIDLPQVTSAEVLKKLRLYKLRADVAIDDVSAQYGVGVTLKGEQGDISQVALVYADPRCDQMGLRAIIASAQQKSHDLLASNLATYDALRIAHCVPMGGRDFIYGDAFPHDVNMDLLSGVDFKKGCYVGQEVVSRTHHRDAARTRIVQVIFPDGICAREGADVMAGEKRIGTLGTCMSGKALAQIRLDRFKDAHDAGLSPDVDGVVLSVLTP